MTDAADGLGSVATGALLAREVERARVGAPAVGHAEHEPCANCGTIRQGPYCHQCGQAGHVHRNLGALVHDVAHGVFHFEGRIWHTLPLLAWHPGRLTRRYVEGERARFVSPMALFLFSVFLMFAVVSNLPGRVDHHALVQAGGGDMGRMIAERRDALAALHRHRAAAADPAERARLDARIASGERDLRLMATLRKAGVGASGESDAGFAKLDRSDVSTGIGRLDDMIVHASQNPQLLLYKMKSYGYKYSWALIPISLPFVWLLFAFRRDVGLYDHAIFSIYSLAFMSLAVVVLAVVSALGMPAWIIVLAALIVPPVHMYRQLKGAYALGRFGAGWRTVALLCVTFATSLLFLTFLFYLGSE